MKKAYVAKKIDKYGYVNYTTAENNVWRMLYKRQYSLIEDYACDDYRKGFNELSFSSEEIPQIPEINHKLKLLTGWQLEPVAGIIPFDRFFNLLAEKKFPAATFIRHADDLNFLSEPDIFHEIIGHCPLLLNEQYAEFSHRYGCLGSKASGQDQAALARLYWFTIETGLFKTETGFKAYGGATLSSYTELKYAIQSDYPLHIGMDVLDVLRTPYRYDILPCVYFHIHSLDELSGLSEEYLVRCALRARELGCYPSLYPPALEKAV